MGGDELAGAVHRLPIYRGHLVGPVARFVELATSDDDDRELRRNGKAHQAHVLVAVPLGDQVGVVSIVVSAQCSASVEVQPIAVQTPRSAT